MGDVTPHTGASVASSLPPSGRTTPFLPHDDHHDDHHNDLHASPHDEDHEFSSSMSNISDGDVSSISSPQHLPVSGMEEGSESPLVIGGPGVELDMKEGFRLDVDAPGAHTRQRIATDQAAEDAKLAS